MAQWAKVAKSPFVMQEMQEFYRSQFPMEVRYFLCEWIENQHWEQLDEATVSHHPVALELIQQMLELLRQKINDNVLHNPDFFVTRIQLEQFIQKVESNAQSNPFNLIKVIKECLRQEQQLIEQAEQTKHQAEHELNQTTNVPEQNGLDIQIQIVIHTLMEMTKETETMSKDMQLKQELFIYSFSEGQNLSNQLEQLNKSNMTAAEKAKTGLALTDEKRKVDQRQNQLASELLHLRIALGHKYEKTITDLQELATTILEDKIVAWKQQQQLSGNGLVMNSSDLDTLQKWCEELANLIWQNRQQIKKVIKLQKQLPIKFPNNEYDRMPHHDEAITTLLTTLVTSTFIVEQQPPQVLKKGARFGAVVRLLVGGKLNVHMNPPQVEATIISSSQAKKLLSGTVEGKPETSGDILNNSGAMEYDLSNGQLSINLRNMTLKKIKRMGKKGAEAVTEEKFCLLFQSEFRMGGDELIFEVWTLSLPVVVIVHGTQECNAMATILWDNAFSQPGREPFVVPDQVEWHQMAEQLDLKFKSSTGKGLSEDNKTYIASKLFGSNDPSQCHVTWSQFNKERLQGKQFTFWEWFYTIEKLTKDHMKDLWMDDAIIGFLSKAQSNSWLSAGHPDGTFLLRFSDSKIGCISVAWLEGYEVRHYSPCSSKDLQTRGLADRIKDLEQLTWLYPNKNKNAVFSKYYTNITDTTNVNEDGYTKPELKSRIPKLYSSNCDDSSSLPFSPDSIYSSPPSAATLAQMDGDERVPMTPLENGFAEMDITSFNETDYMPDDIGATGVGEDLDLSFEDLCTHDPLLQNVIEATL